MDVQQTAGYTKKDMAWTGRGNLHMGMGEVSLNRWVGKSVVVYALPR